MPSFTGGSSLQRPGALVLEAPDVYDVAPRDIRPRWDLCVKGHETQSFSRKTQLSSRKFRAPC